MLLCASGFDDGKLLCKLYQAVSKSHGGHLLLWSCFLAFRHESLKTVRSAGLVKELPQGKREVREYELCLLSSARRQSRLLLHICWDSIQFCLFCIPPISQITNFKRANSQRALQSVHIWHPCPRTSHRIRKNSPKNRKKTFHCEKKKGRNLQDCNRGGSLTPDGQVQSMSCVQKHYRVKTHSTRTGTR